MHGPMIRDCVPLMRVLCESDARNALNETIYARSIEAATAATQ